MKNLTLNSIEDINNIQHTSLFNGVDNSNDWQCDKWEIKINGIFLCEFKTGLGHRKNKKPVNPKFADIMYSLLLDSLAGEMTHKDFCDNFGYDTDSHNALEIYLQCQKTKENLQCFFSNDTIEKMNELLQDY